MDVSAIHDEPARGSVPPAWFCALSGIERIRALSEGLLPQPPAARLVGLRPTHVSAGSGTWSMPASGWFAGPNGQLEIMQLIEAAALGAATTTLPAGTYAETLTLSMNPFRPCRAQAGNLLARARVVNTSRLFVAMTVEVEDVFGRQIGHGMSQATIREADPPPPAPPQALRPAEEAGYATPDPYLRPAPAPPPDDLWEGNDGLSVAGMYADGSLIAPSQLSFGFRLLHVEKGHVVAEAPASEWFCGTTRFVERGFIAAFANMIGWSVALTQLEQGASLAGLDNLIRFHGDVVADGRPLRLESRVSASHGEITAADVTIHDADGGLVASATGSAAHVPRSRRRRPARREPRRVLATLLFTDIVGSTTEAERLGDARWSALLEKHDDAVRRAIAAAGGVEVKSTGDGFLARFESPGRAVECARAARDAVRALGLEIRVGLHTGECELNGRDLAGMAVHVAARIEAAAKPDEILVSGTVRDLVAGSDLRFSDRGEHELQGVPEPWRLYAVE